MRAGEEGEALMVVTTGDAPAATGVALTGAWPFDEELLNGELFAALAAQPPGSATRCAVRRRLIEHNLPRAVRLARRFQDRGEPLADLEQVAAIGLIHAVDRFDPRRGVPFGGFLVPTVVGELKRHFRDRGWDMRVSRRLQELKRGITAATNELTAKLRRSPTDDEVAAHLGVRPQELIEGRLAAQAYDLLTLNLPPAGERSNGYERQELLGSPDEELERIPDMLAVRQEVRQLPQQEQQVLALRFYGNMTQAQIAERIGVSQMQVSRLLARALGSLRKQLRDDDGQDHDSRTGTRPDDPRGDAPAVIGPVLDAVPARTPSTPATTGHEPNREPTEAGQSPDGGPRRAAGPPDVTGAGPRRRRAAGTVWLADRPVWRGTVRAGTRPRRAWATVVLPPSRASPRRFRYAVFVGVSDAR